MIQGSIPTMRQACPCDHTLGAVFLLHNNLVIHKTDPFSPNEQDHEQAMDCAGAARILLDMSRKRFRGCEQDHEQAMDCAGAARILLDMSRKRFRGYDRKEELSHMHVAHFRNGSIQIQEGLALRSVLANKLGCVSSLVRGIIDHFVLVFCNITSLPGRRTDSEGLSSSRLVWNDRALKLEIHPGLARADKHHRRSEG